MAHTRSFTGIPSTLKSRISASIKKRENDYSTLGGMEVKIVDTLDNTFKRRYKDVTHQCISVIFTGSPGGLQRATSWIRAAINIWLREYSLHKLPYPLSQPLSGVFQGVDNKLMVDWRTAMGM